MVASAIGALPDMVQPDGTGLVVPPLNPAALASAVSRLLADEPLRRRLGAQGRRLSERYTIDAHRQAVEDAYDEAIRRRRTGSSAADRGDGARPTAGRIRRIVDESLLRNSASLLLATIAIAGGGFVFWQLVTHLFDLADVGLAGAMISLSILLSNLALLGMPNSMIRYLAEWPDPARTVNGGALLVAVAALGAAWCFATVATLFAPRLAQALGPPRAAAFCVFTTASALCMLYDNVFIALRRSGQVLRRNLLVVALRLTLPVFLVGMHAFGVFTAYWLAFTVASVPYPFVLRRIFGRCPRQPPASVTRVRRMARYSLAPTPRVSS